MTILEKAKSELDSCTQINSLFKHLPISNNILVEIANIIRIIDMCRLSSDSDMSEIKNWALDVAKTIDGKSGFPIGFATTNKYKLKEFIEYTCQDRVFRCIKDLFQVQDSLLQSVDIPESEISFIYNAASKSIAYSKMYHDTLILSEDSGLSVPLLDLAPGVISARIYKNHEQEINDFIAPFRLDLIGDESNQVDELLKSRDVLNSITIFLLMAKKENGIGKLKLHYPAMLTTTSSLSLNGKELGNATGVLNGIISFTKFFDLIDDKITILDFLKELEGFGYNPIFNIVEHQEDLSNFNWEKFQSDNDVDKHLIENVMQRLEDTEGYFCHRRNAFNKVLIDFIHLTIKYIGVEEL